jgi:hypothetical protein
VHFTCDLSWSAKMLPLGVGSFSQMELSIDWGADPKVPRSAAREIRSFIPGIRQRP